MKENKRNRKYLTAGIIICTLLGFNRHAGAQQMAFTTRYSSVSINKSGFITSIRDKQTNREYNPRGLSSPLLALEKEGKNIYPVSAKLQGKQLKLTYPNGTIATLKIDEKNDYLRFELLSLLPRNGVDNVIWGPYKTNISKTIGEILSVVRSENFAIGILALNDNTTSGPPCNGDMYQSCYIIHSPDPAKYPLPANLKEGQRFRIGGDGINDVAFYSHPEEYYRYMNGNGASLEPDFGSSIVLHSRDRKKPYTIFYPHFNDFPGVKSPRHMELTPVDVDYIGSAIAFYACPDSLGLQTIEQIVKNEGLPYITRNGKWVKDPSNYQTDIAWWGPHDSLVSYAGQLGLKAVQDEGLGEYYTNPANRWGDKKVTLNQQKRPISDLTALTNKEGVAYGLHTLTEFIQPFSSDVHPVPNDGLCTVLKTHIAKTISANDTLIQVVDTSYLNEFGGWDDNKVNVLKIGKELIRYKGVTTTKPYTLTGVERGALKTNAAVHHAGEQLAKLQVNCYGGFIPDIALQDDYAAYYARLLHDGGMNYIDFDGFESFTYQGHGQYSFKRFMRGMFDHLKEMNVPYVRVMGSCVFEGNWHYMSVCNVGGGNHMFDPVNNKWGIEGKDMRYSFNGSYFPATFGIQNLQRDWTVQVVENLQCKSIAWEATYMLGLSQDAVEKRTDKQAIFKAFRTWENAKNAGAFGDALKKEMQEEKNVYHLEQLDDNTWKLYKAASDGVWGSPEILKRSKAS
ncbi:hypothetical protein AB6805_24695 [Chitinophaga sp. RCC_12]|uniref:hypothetical protein n=1 Tax=Chitinophaga sp. RCC_12 TaxID=3239226 RepID=UPI003524E669